MNSPVEPRMLEKNMKGSPFSSRLSFNNGESPSPPELAKTYADTESSASMDSMEIMGGSLDESALVSSKNCICRLECVAQQYAWGRTGSSALVARMKASQSPEFSIQEDGPYAELWMGTHPNGMSEVVLPTGERMPLLDYVRKSPVLHCGVSDEDCDLSFLFKVLSIRKVLSIQAHPDRALAEQLHAERPTVYKDPNHKPEMAVALSDDFEAMSGFRSVKEIARHVQEYPEFAALIEDDAKAGLLQSEAEPRQVLKSVFRSYMEAKDDVIQRELKTMVSRLNGKSELSDCDELIMRLADQFPGDCGIFAPLLFNHLRLKKGEAFYIGANEPHAYIQGEILECMACSDNVVRAGLTPKLKDVDTLVNMLTYETSVPSVTRGEKMRDGSRLYKPPAGVDDFCMEIVNVRPGEAFEFSHVASPSVILTLEGSGSLEQGSVRALEMDLGKAAFMSSDTRATAVAGDQGLRLVRARSNVAY